VTVSTVSQGGDEGMHREQLLFVTAVEQEPNESNMSALHP